MILGSSRAGTLKLYEDERGLKVRAELPNTSAGRDAAELLRRGDVDSMSFGFSVPSGGDEWSADGSERTLKSVRLHEVSIVAFPAYSGTAGTTSVRGLDTVAKRAEVDAEALADVWMKVEEGETLSEDEGRLLSQVVDSLTEKPEATEPDLGMLNLKKKKLDLLIGK
jgi:phage head maturation protease